VLSKQPGILSPKNPLMFCTKTCLVGLRPASRLKDNILNIKAKSRNLLDIFAGTCSLGSSSQMHMLFITIAS
jgi:hypothetical protein